MNYHEKYLMYKKKYLSIQKAGDEKIVTIKSLDEIQGGLQTVSEKIDDVKKNTNTILDLISMMHDLSEKIYEELPLYLNFWCNNLKKDTKISQEECKILLSLGDYTINKFSDKLKERLNNITQHCNDEKSGAPNDTKQEIAIEQPVEGTESKPESEPKPEPEPEIPKSEGKESKPDTASNSAKLQEKQIEGELESVKEKVEEMKELFLETTEKLETLQQQHQQIAESKLGEQGEQGEQDSKGSKGMK